MTYYLPRRAYDHTEPRPRRAHTDAPDQFDDLQTYQMAAEQLAQGWTVNATDHRVSDETAAAWAACAEQLRQTLRGSRWPTSNA